jgi:hypothetical protein
MIGKYLSDQRIREDRKLLTFAAMFGNVRTGLGVLVDAEASSIARPWNRRGLVCRGFMQ